MKNSDKNSPKKEDSVNATNGKKPAAKKSDNLKNQKTDPNFRPAGSDTLIGDGSAGMGGTSAI